MPCENVPKHATTDAPTLIKSYPHKPDSFLSMALIFLWLGATLIYTVLIASIVLAPSKTVRMALIGLVVLLAVLPLPKSPLTKNPIHKLGECVKSREQSERQKEDRLTNRVCADEHPVWRLFVRQY